MGKKVDAPGAPPAAPEIEPPPDPGYIITLAALLNRANSSGPFGSTVYGDYVTDPDSGEQVFQPWNTSDQEFIDALSGMNWDDPDIGQLAALWPSNVVSYESPELQALRFQQQGNQYAAGDIYGQYMSPFGADMGGFPGAASGPVPPGQGPGVYPQVAPPMVGGEQVDPQTGLPIPRPGQLPWEVYN